jgi:hypothetical protein
MSFRPYTAIKSTGLQFNYTNASGYSIPKGTPVKIRTDGNIDFINVSVEHDIMSFGGITSSDSDNGQKSGVVTAGRIENVVTTFEFGDAVYIGKDGLLTNVGPSFGVAGFVSGDFVFRVGTIAKNETNPLSQDLILESTLVGQL